MARYANAVAPIGARKQAHALALPQRRRRRRVERRIPWPGDVTSDTLIMPSVGDIPEWINGPRARTRKVLGMTAAATLLLDVAYVIMHLAG